MKTRSEKEKRKKCTEFIIHVNFSIIYLHDPGSLLGPMSLLWVECLLVIQAKVDD